MKKITLAIVLLTIGVQAQVFPAPYCDIPDDAVLSVEEITSVTFADASISNTNTTNALIDETATIAIVAQEETYTIEIKGNTYGNFDTDIVAFIDWNKNDVLDDEGEIYNIGTLTNTNGTDGSSVSLDIIVPIDAILSATRIRITKTYQDAQSPAEIDPCGILFNPGGQEINNGFGQALDFTLEVVGVLSVAAFDLNSLSVYPMPTQDVLNISYKSAIDSVQVYNLLGQAVYAKRTAATALKIDVASLPVGMYVVKLVSEGQQHSFKMLKE